MVEVGGFHEGMTRMPETVIPKLIAHDEDDVWRGHGLLLGCGGLECVRGVSSRKWWVAVGK
jgi:hypothetical protein